MEQPTWKTHVESGRWLTTFPRAGATWNQAEVDDLFEAIKILDAEADDVYAILLRGPGMAEVNAKIQMISASHGRSPIAVLWKAAADMRLSEPCARFLFDIRDRLKKQEGQEREKLRPRTFHSSQARPEPQEGHGRTSDRGAAPAGGVGPRPPGPYRNGAVRLGED